MFYRVAFFVRIVLTSFFIRTKSNHWCPWSSSLPKMARFICLQYPHDQKNKNIRIVLKTPESHFTFTPLLCDGGQWPNFQKLKVSPILAVFQSKHQKLQNNFGLPLDLTFSMNKIENLASQVKRRGIRWQKFGNNCQNKCFSRSKATIYCDREFIYG